MFLTFRTFPSFLRGPAKITKPLFAVKNQFCRGKLAQHWCPPEKLTLDRYPSTNTYNSHFHHRLSEEGRSLRYQAITSAIFSAKTICFVLPDYISPCDLVFDSGLVTGWPVLWGRTTAPASVPCRFLPPSSSPIRFFIQSNRRPCLNCRCQPPSVARIS